MTTFQSMVPAFPVNQYDSAQAACDDARALMQHSHVEDVITPTTLQFEGYQFRGGDGYDFPTSGGGASGGGGHGVSNSDVGDAKVIAYVVVGSIVAIVLRGLWLWAMGLI